MLPLCFTAFFCFGVCLVLIGANQAQIAADMGLNLSRSGMLGAALAAGLGGGVVGAGPLFDRRPRRPLFVASSTLAAAALLSVDAATGFPRLLVTTALLGVGIGAYDTFINALVVERFGKNAARPMTVVHAGATLGAITGPLLVELLAANHHWSASFRLTGLAHLAIAAAAFGLRFPGPPTPDRTSDAASAGVFRVLRSRSLLPFALVAFAYVGIEGAATIFALPYAGDAGGLSEARGRATISALWSGLLVGRLAAAPLVGRHGPRVLLAAGPLAAACLCVGVLAGAHHAAATFAAVGLALGGVFPVMISLAAQQFPDAPGTAAGLAAGAGALGGAAIPWITGLIGDGVSVTAAVGSLALWCAAIAAGAAAITRLPAPRPAARR